MRKVLPTNWFRYRVYSRRRHRQAPTRPLSRRGRMIASKLIELRQARSLSRPQLARHARVARAHLWSIEAGKIIPGIATLKKLSEALGVSLNRLLTKSEAEMLLEDPFVQKIQPLLPRLNLEHRRLILKTLQAAPQNPKNAKKVRQVETWIENTAHHKRRK
jgi:transcriptional regulator with XRE-family HTH domain